MEKDIVTYLKDVVTTINSIAFKNLAEELFIVESFASTRYGNRISLRNLSSSSTAAGESISMEYFEERMSTGKLRVAKIDDKKLPKTFVIKGFKHLGMKIIDDEEKECYVAGMRDGTFMLFYPTCISYYHRGKQNQITEKKGYKYSIRSSGQTNKVLVEHGEYVDTSKRKQDLATIKLIQIFKTKAELVEFTI